MQIWADVCGALWRCPSRPPLLQTRSGLRPVPELLPDSAKFGRVRPDLGPTSASRALAQPCSVTLIDRGVPPTPAVARRALAVASARALLLPPTARASMEDVRTGRLRPTKPVTATAAPKVAANATARRQEKARGPGAAGEGESLPLSSASA